MRKNGRHDGFDFGLGSVRSVDGLQPSFYFHGLDLLQAHVAPARKNPRLSVHRVGVLRRDFVPRQFFATVMLPEVPDALRQTLPPRLIVDCESKSVRCRLRCRFGRVPFQGPDLLLPAYRRSVGAFFPPPVNPYRGASLPLFEYETADLITCACPFKQGSSLGLNGTHCRVQNIPGRAPISKFFPPLIEPQPAIVSSHSLRADARNRHSFPICLAGISPRRAFARSVFG